MQDRIIAVNVDVSKIDKSRLIKGAKGTYLDIILMPRDDPYGNNYMAVQGVPKEDRDAGNRGAILGNGKFIGESRQAQAPAPDTSHRMPDDVDGDDMPF